MWPCIVVASAYGLAGLPLGNREELTIVANHCYRLISHCMLFGQAIYELEIKGLCKYIYVISQ